MSISRRKFAQLLGAGVAAAVTRPTLSLAKNSSESPPTILPRTNVVRLSSNENPYGPSSRCFQAMTEDFPLACRYPDKHAEALVDALANLNSVERTQILLGDGSGEILKLAADAFTGPPRNKQSTRTGGPLVVADPTF